MGILAKLGFIFIILVIGAILLYVYDKSLFYSIITPSAGLYGNKTVLKAQITFVSNEVNAIESSSPIPINPANILVFGIWKNTSVRICGQEQALFTYNSTLMDVKYQDFYVPTIAELEAEYVPNSNYTNLIGQKVYLDFILNNNENASAPYIINKIYAQGNEVYWIFNQSTGISNNNAVSFLKNITIQTLAPKGVNGVVFLNGTALISPNNPYIDNGNFIAPYCQ